VGQNFSRSFNFF